MHGLDSHEGIPATSKGYNTPTCSYHPYSTELSRDDANMARWTRESQPVIQQEQLSVSNDNNLCDGYLEEDSNESSSYQRTKDMETLDKSKKSCWKRNLSLYKGLLYSFMSGLFVSFSSVIVKHAKDIPPGELAVLMFVGILVSMIPVVIYSRQNIFGPRSMRHLLILRGIVGSTNIYLRFVAFRYLPIADASVIVFSVPVFVFVFAKIFLKEPCGFFHSFIVFVTVLGLVLITKLPILLADQTANYSSEYIYGLCAGIGSTIFGAIVYIVIRKMPGIHHSVITFNLGWVAVIETVALTFATSEFTVPACGFEQWLVVLLTITNLCGQSIFTLALKQEVAGPVSVVKSATDIILAFFWQVLLFGEIPDGYSICGAVLVVTCIAFVGVHKWVISMPENSSLKRKLIFVTK